jgi:hypothetical protein
VNYSFKTEYVYKQKRTPLRTYTTTLIPQALTVFILAVHALWPLTPLLRIALFYSLALSRWTGNSTKLELTSLESDCVGCKQTKSYTWESARMLGVRVNSFNESGLGEPEQDANSALTELDKGKY